MLTYEDIKPFKGMSKKLTQEVVDEINQLLNDPDMVDIYKENFLQYGHVVREGKFSLVEYTNAIKFASHKLCGLSNLDAYARVYPDRYNYYLARGKSKNDMAAIASVVNRSKLVTTILKQAHIPIWLLNAHIFQQAVNVQAEIMLNPNVSPKTRSDAANSLMNHLKAPESHKIELEVGMKQDKTLDDLRAAISKLSDLQEHAIKTGGMTAKQIAEESIVEATWREE